MEWDCYGGASDRARGEFSPWFPRLARETSVKVGTDAYKKRADLIFSGCQKKCI